MSETLTQNDSILLWEKQNDESDKAFAAFVLFRDAASTRTFQKVADALHCSHANVRQWASRWNWRQRVDAFDRDADEKHREEMARGRKEMRTRQANIGMVMQSVAAHGLQELQQKIAMKLPLNMTSDEISRLMDCGGKMERAARGEGTEGQYTQIIVNLGDAEDDPEPITLTPDAKEDDVIN